MDTGKKYPKIEKAREYRRIHGMEMPTLKLARIMYAENNLLFKDVEDCRDKLRAAENKNGNRYARDKEFIMKEHRPFNPYKIPKSEEVEYKPYFIKGHKRIAGLFDIHVPYHNMAALTAAISFCKKEKVDAVLLGGDFWDFYQLSRFLKDPTKRHFSEELKSGTTIINIIQKELDCKIYFKYGNHEERYDHFLFQKAKELIGVEEFALDELIKKRLPNIEIIKDKRIIRTNGLNIIHGHEYTQGVFSPVNVARGLFLRGKTSALQGHSHQTSEHTESDMNGKITTTWSVGCLCELHPEYAPLNKWNHGFCIVDLDGNSFDVRNKRILKGNVL